MDGRGWNWYGTKDLQVIPYMPGTPVYLDETYPYLYGRTKAEGKLESTFCGDEMNLGRFVAFFEKLKTMQVLAEIKDDKRIIPVGYSWVATPRGIDGARAATCGFCFFSGSSQRDSARNLARLALAYAMLELKIDVLHGIQLESNIAARNFSRKVGFKEVATVSQWHYSQGELVGATVMILEADTYLPKFEEWFRGQKAQP